MSAAGYRAAAWDELAEPAPPVGTLALDTLADLPVPAQRLLNHALVPGMRLTPTVALWIPQALTPQMGATWTPIDATRAEVTLRAGDQMVAVAVTVDDDGGLRELSTQRWGDPESGNFGLYPFGGDVDQHASFDGVTIATAGRAGWWWGTERQAEGEFFRYRILDARLI